MFLSFDMSTFDCVTTVRIPYFQNYLNQYLPHPAAGTFNGKAILSTFGGEWCTWGQGSGVSAVNSGWGIVMGSQRNSTYYMPAYTMGDGPSKSRKRLTAMTSRIDTSSAFSGSLSQYDIDAEINVSQDWPTIIAEEHLD